MSDAPDSLFGDGGKIVLAPPKSVPTAASEPEVDPICAAVKAAANAAKVAANAVQVAAQAAHMAVVEAKVAANAVKAAHDVQAATDAIIGAKLKGKFQFIGNVIRELNSRGLTFDDVGRNPCNWLPSNLLLSYVDKSLDITSGLPDMPAELVGEIAREMSVQDLNNMRLVNARFKTALSFQYGKTTSVTENVTIFPTLSSIAAFLIGLSLDGAYAGTVRKITLIGEGPKTPELSYDISWIHLYMGHTIDWSEQTQAQKIADVRILEDVNDNHAEWDWINKPFCHTGGYRTMLTIMLAKLPNLKTIVTRKLRPGEHIPGWSGHEALKELSFYRLDLPINEVYYGDWQYDEDQKRVTMYTDEYGEDIVEENAGPQVGFKEDVIAAMAMSGTNASLV